MKFKTLTSEHEGRGKDQVATLGLSSDTGRYLIVKGHHSDPCRCEIRMYWRSRTGRKGYKRIQPTFRIKDGKIETSMFALRELLAFLKFVPETIRVRDLQAMLRAMAKHYGGLVGSKTRQRCELDIRTLTDKSLFRGFDLELGMRSIRKEIQLGGN